MDQVREELQQMLRAKTVPRHDSSQYPALVEYIKVELIDRVPVGADLSRVALALVFEAALRAGPVCKNDRGESAYPLRAAKHLLALGEYPEDVHAEVPDTAMSLYAIKNLDPKNPIKANDPRGPHTLGLRAQIAALASKYGESRGVLLKEGSKRFGEVVTALHNELQSLVTDQNIVEILEARITNSDVWVPAEPSNDSVNAILTTDHRRVDGVVVAERAKVAALGQSDAVVEHRLGVQGQRQSPPLDAAAQEAARQLLWHLEELGVVLLAFHLAVSETYLPRKLADAVYEGIRSRKDLIYKALFEYVRADFFGVELVRTSSGRQLLHDLGIPTHLEVLGDFALSDEERSLARAAIGKNIHLEPRTLLEVLTRETEAETVIDAWRDALTVAQKYFDIEQKAVKSNNHGIDMRWPMASQVESVRKAFLLNLSDVIIILRDTGIASGHTERWMYGRLRRVWEALVNATQFASDDESWPPSFRDVLETGTHGIVFDVEWADRWRSFRGGAYDETQRTFWDELISSGFREETIATKKWLDEYLERSAWDPDFRRQEMDQLLKDSDEEWLREYGDPTLLDEHPPPDDRAPKSDLPPLFAD